MEYNKPVGTDVLLERLSFAAQELINSVSTLTPAWSEINRLRRGDIDVGLGGAPDVLHAVHSQQEADGTLTGTAGDSYVLMVRWDADGNVQSESIQPFGSAPLDEKSAHYNDQSALFAARKLKPVWMDEDLIRANLERSYRPGF